MWQESAPTICSVGKRSCKTSAARAAEVLQAPFPTLQILGADSCHLSANAGAPGDLAALARVCAAKPHLLLVALGTPKQELWIHSNAGAFAPAVAIGVGASLDFI